jgi:hypothetical protein
MTTKKLPDHWRKRVNRLWIRIQGMEQADAEGEICELLDDCMRELVLTHWLQETGMAEHPVGQSMLHKLVETGDSR